MRSTFIFILLLTSTFCNAQTEKLDSIFNALLTQNIVGTGAAIFGPDEIYYSKGFGYADLENKTPYTTSTIQNIASISKTTIGVSLLKAQEMGLLKLDDPVSNYLPFELKNPYFPEEVITIRHFATHTASVFDREKIYEKESYDYTGDSKWALGDFVTEYYSPKGKWYKKKNFLKSKPGEKYEYSNIGAGLTAYVIEQASGMPYNEFTKKYIFEPLGMEGTGWFLSEIDREKHSHLYVDKKGTLEEIDLYGLATYSDGGLRTSINDLTTYLQAFMNEGAGKNGRVLEASSVKEMLAPNFESDQLPEEFNSVNHGIYWEHDQVFNTEPLLIGHTGGDPAVLTVMMMDPEKNVGYVFFINSDATNDNIRTLLAAWKEMLVFGGSIS